MKTAAGLARTGSRLLPSRERSLALWRCSSWTRPGGGSGRCHGRGPAQVRFPGRATPDIVDEHDGARLLVVREPGRDVPREPLGRHLAVAGRRHDGRHSLPEALVRQPHDESVANPRVLEEDLLDLFGEDLLAAGVDDPAVAAAEGDRAIGLYRGEVAGDYPALAADGPEGLLGLGGVAEVADLVVSWRGQHAYLAGAGHNVAAFFVDDSCPWQEQEPRRHHVVAAPGLADRERAALGRGDHVAADKVRVHQQPPLDVSTPRHADAQHAAQAG